ncbi:erythromycin esterase family protein [Actinoplanes sp. TRM 88003]|uniref:Erythromycin esterase family protein n=1 Tax=Paractinoplanes aksuensis TaxID=2939490 RepID=A0ABT1DHW3_9ACTN|nr:erythromycin esterase family protein [Actinoplanes aksuensis]MCO8270409.1 erythromycin esterase family protein [Actinoplanes aksuensis]
MRIDLGPLVERIGDARVVAIGESAHFVREYHSLRQELIGFLHERAGFTTVAFESGFSEGLSVREWMRGGAGDPPADGMTYRFAQCSEMRELLHLMKERSIDYWGLDLPGDLGSFGPALDHLDRLPGAPRSTLSAVRRLVSKFASAYTIPAFSAYREMALIDRDALTLALAELSARLDALPDRPDAVARHEVRLLVLLDQMLRAQAAAVEGAPEYARLNVRDAAMARTAEWILDRTPGRVIIAAANSHIQRRHPMFDVLGTHLSAMLGDDYVAVGVTCEGGRVATRRLAPDAPAMAETVEVGLEPPVAGSIEAAMASGRVTIADPSRFGADKIRLLDLWAEQPVAEAFDLVACVPVSTPTEQAIWSGGRP